MAPSQHPLRTALIGLSAKPSWAAAAHLPGLLTPAGRSKVQITALLNSSQQAAKAAIEKYQLPAETKAYGSPDELANDPDVDLVICNTRVDKHFDTILPSIKKGKDVFVEWPIASNKAEIQTLVEAARKSGSRVAVGLQRRWAPPVVKLREVLQNGFNGKQLGKILSSDVKAFGGGAVDRQTFSDGIKYFTDRKVGGNVITIGTGHLLDMILSVVGDLDPASVQPKLQIQRPTAIIRDSTEKIQSDVPDLISVQGTLKSSSATLTYYVRRGQPFPNTPVVTWSINCEFGELLLVSPEADFLEPRPGTAPLTIRVHWHDTNKVEDIPWDWPAEDADLPTSARSVFRTVSAFVDGKEPGNGWVSIEDAAERASLIDGFFTEWDKSKR